MLHRKLKRKISIEVFIKNDYFYLYKTFFALVMGIKATGSPWPAMPEHSEPVGLGLAGKWAGVKMKRRERKSILYRNFLIP